MAVDPNAAVPQAVPLVPPSLIKTPTTSAPAGAPTPSPPPVQAAPGGGYTPVENMSIPAEGRALLSTIGAGESQGNYRARYNQPDFHDYGAHPNTYAKITSGPNKNRTSNSAGRYQFISTTWADQQKKLGLKDFSPQNQDAAAWNLAKEAYAQKYRGRNLEADIKDPSKMRDITSALKSQWTSVPGGIEQVAGYNIWGKRYKDALKAELARSGQPMPTQVAGPGAPQSGVPNTGILTSDNWARGPLPASGPYPGFNPAPISGQTKLAEARNPLYDNPRSP